MKAGSRVRFRKWWPFAATCLLSSTVAHAQTPTSVANTQAPPAPNAALAQPAPTDLIKASGFVQVDGVLWNDSSRDELDQSSRAPLNQERILVRRARIRLDAQHGFLRGMVMVDANTVNGPAIRVLGAELALAYPSPPTRPIIEGMVGLFLIPFGFENTEQVASRLFLEPATWVRALFPGRRDIGARVQGAFSFLRYSLAVMNGNPISGSAFPLRDPNRAKDVMGRLGIDKELWPALRVSAGVSLLYGKGFHAGTAPTKDALTVDDANHDGVVEPDELKLVPGKPGEPSRNFDRHAFNADTAVGFTLPWLGAGRVYGELTWAQDLDRGLYLADPVAQMGSQRELGYAAAIAQHVTHHVELGARYDHYDPDHARRHDVEHNASLSTIAGAVAWCGVEHLRVSLEYDHQTKGSGRRPQSSPFPIAADTLTLRAQLEL